MKKPTPRSTSSTLAGSLFAAEQSLDAAMTETAELMVDMLKARKDPSATSTMSELISAKLEDAMAALSEARSAMVDAHNELVGLKRYYSTRSTEKLGRSPLTGQFVLKPAGRSDAAKATKVREVTQKIAVGGDS